MPLVKNYLVKYLDKVMDEPEEIVKELIKEKDEKIVAAIKETDNQTLHDIVNESFTSEFDA